MSVYDTKFLFEKYEGALEKGQYNFYYSIQRNGRNIQFVDSLRFTAINSHQIPPELLKALLNTLHLAFGISYWKLFCPRKIMLDNITLSQEQAIFWNTVYRKGLGEFFYQNKIDYTDLINFPFDKTSPESIVFERKNRSFLLIGGGKDSIVSGELLKRNQFEFEGFVMNEHPIQTTVMNMMDVQGLSVHHDIDPKLITLSGEEGSYNGHVPISALYASVSIFAAVLYDYRYVITSNERSANIGNIEYLGEEINHQWSKSYEFENLFQHYVKTYITPSIMYFSLLRPITEIHITKLFSKMEKYFPIFSSCNRNFTIEKSLVHSRWCGTCPKCATAFLLLAAFVDKEKLTEIFGKNLLADKSLISLYERLLGLQGFKPFECVATIEEARWAMRAVVDSGKYEEDDVIIHFKERMLSNDSQEEQPMDLFHPSHDHLIPEIFQKIINSYET